jgi:hypothetical protein
MRFPLDPAGVSPNAVRTVSGTRPPVAGRNGAGDLLSRLDFMARQFDDEKLRLAAELIAVVAKGS